MARAIHPIHTIRDDDVLFALTTEAVGQDALDDQHIVSPKKPAVATYLRCPRRIPSFNAFCRNEPSVLLVSFIIPAIGVLAFEWARNSFTSALVYSRRTIVFFVFLATSISI
jgi:hypothetical protein